MTKVFRRPRNESISQNKTGRYLIYALGESVLVIIGILVALSIDEWAEDKAKAELEDVYLINLERDLQNQLDAISTQIEWETNFIEAGTPLLRQYFSTGDLVTDSLFMKRLSVMIVRKTFVRIDPTYTVLLSSGTIDLIQDNDFKNGLVMYYQELERIEKIILNNNTLFTDQVFLPLAMKLGNLHNIEIDKETLESSTGSQQSRSDAAERLTEISRKLLKDEENLLVLLNSVRYRVNVATNHRNWLSDMTKATQRLIDKIKQANTKNNEG